MYLSLALTAVEKKRERTCLLDNINKLSKSCSLIGLEMNLQRFPRDLVCPAGRRALGIRTSTAMKDLEAKTYLQLVLQSLFPSPCKNFLYP